MPIGAHILRASIFLNFSLVILVLTLLAPQVLQNAAQTVFYWETNVIQQDYSFAALLIGIAFIIYAISEKSLKKEGEVDYRYNQAP